MKDPELNNAYKERSIYFSGLVKKLTRKRNTLQKQSRKYSNFRLLIFLIEVILFFVLFFSASNISAIISAAIFFVLFGIIAHFHNKLDIGIKKFDLWINIKSTHLARLKLEWENIPEINLQPKPDFTEIDLNIAGEESLMQLINTGTSRQSKLLLRKWLNNKLISVNEVLERQNVVRELLPLQNFRDKLTLHSVLSSHTEFNDDLLYKVLNGKEFLNKTFYLIFFTLIILAPINVLLFVLFLNNILPAYWGISLFIYVTLFHFGNKEKEKILNDAEFISIELEKIRSVFKFLETFPLKNNSGLNKICSPFTGEKLKPSALVKKIRNISEMLRIRKGNPLVWNVMRIVFPIDLYYKIKLNKYKHLVSGKLDSWLEAWYNLEALSSLANFGYLNPEYNFPEIVELKDNKTIFSGKNLGHPLIKKEKKIANDFNLNPQGEISIITGSNMSGKSTFIRTLGINLSLAYAGSVVNADSLRATPFRLFTCIKVSDSLIDGISYFYAEVKRLKMLLDKIEKTGYPVFFLIDEIFRGTNNIERLKGSYSFIKNLAEKNTLGVIATHDLELVKLSDKIKRVTNYHFKEEINNGKMIFDYKLNKGPCPTTNALIIMKLEGLLVDNEE